MNYKKVSASVRRIAKRTLTQDDLASQIIIQRGNVYHAFVNYRIEETVFGWQVLADMMPAPLVFNTAKVALAWCIAHKFARFELAKSLQFLDSRVAAKQFDIDLITERLENAVVDLDDRAILIARLMEDINSRQSYKQQLAKCVVTAKGIKLPK